MGPLRRGLILALLPTSALAEVCDKARPDWDGSPVSPIAEALFLFSSVPALALLLASALAFRFRNQWAGLAVVILWACLTSLIVLAPPSENQQLAIAEGCIGQPWLFLVIVFALCAVLVIRTAPLKSPDDPA